MKITLIKPTSLSNILIYFIFCFYSGSIIYGQKPVEKTLRLSKLHYENSSGEKGLTTFLYDEFGIMYKAKWRLLDGSRSSLNFHTFDENGNTIQKYREFSDGITSKLLYKYDENGKLISESFERSDGVTGTTNYIYNESGKLIRADCAGLNGWFHGILFYNYDDTDRKTGATIQQNGNRIGVISYDHDDHGSLIKEYWDFSGNWNQTFVYEYGEVEKSTSIFYTSSNVFITNTGTNQLIEEKYDYNKQNGGPSYFEYDITGKLVKKVFERSDGLKTETTFEYASNGILKRSIRKYSNGLTATFTYRYNGNRKLINRFFERSDGIKGSETYEYDGKWNLTKAFYDNFDAWLTGVITFEHDQKEMLKKGHFKGKKFDAELFFENDGFGNITKIHWEFSFRATQTYWFNYTKIN